tara:strand:- start:1882 stop:3273 length:1392 start_codon:yes stop_codon:yes gene_type:complete
MKLAKNIFKAYDIRGIYEEELSLDSVKLIAKALSNLFPENNDTIIIGRDGRHSSSKISEALIESFLKNGKNIINIGQVPTPLVYFARNYLKKNSCIMVTGSHNPKNYNGLKIFMDGHTLHGYEIEKIYNFIIKDKYKNTHSAKTSYKEINLKNEYIDQIIKNIDIVNKKKIAVDAGNGVAGPIAIETYERLGFDVVDLYCDIDGDFPNHHPNPSDPGNLKDLVNTVKKSKCDIGIAFDGDGDRCLIVDNLGNIIWPDKQMMLFAREILLKNKRCKIIYDVKCSAHLPKVIEDNGGVPIMSRTGHSFIKKKISETNAPLAGEMSGHIFFNDKWYGFDDGIYSGARMLEIISKNNNPSCEIFNSFPKSFVTPEINIMVNKDGIQHDFMKRFINLARFDGAKIITIDGLRAEFDDGWGLLRASNTTSCLVMRVEAESKKRLTEIKDEFFQQIKKIDQKIEIPNEKK